MEEVAQAEVEAHQAAAASNLEDLLVVDLLEAEDNSTQVISLSQNKQH